MSHSLFARALASVAVVGVAIAGPAAAAGAATNDTSASAVGVTIDLGDRPVVTTGGATTPRPTVTAAVSVDGAVTVALGAPSTRPVAAPLAGTGGPALLPRTAVAVHRFVVADVRLHACVALALLGGRAPTPCRLPAGSTTPSLADALASVGACARVAVLAATPVRACGAPAPEPGSADTAGPPSLAGVDADADADRASPRPSSGSPIRPGAPSRATAREPTGP